MSADFTVVISHLIAQRDRIETALQVLRSLEPPQKAVLPDAVAKPEAKKAESGRHGPATRKYTRKISKVVADAEPRLTITDAIRRAVKEAPRTSIEIADRVQVLMPGTERNSIGTIIGQRMKAGEFRKDEALKVHFVNGGPR